MYTFEELLNYCEIIDNYSLIMYESLSMEQFNLLINNNREEIDYYLAKNINLTTDQINILLNKNDPDLSCYLAENSNLNTDQVDLFINNYNHYNNYGMGCYLASRHNLSIDQINFLLSTNDDVVASYLAKNLTISIEIKTKIIKDKIKKEIFK